jgi:hypothetical protein
MENWPGRGERTTSLRLMGVRGGPRLPTPPPPTHFISGQCPKGRVRGVRGDEEKGYRSFFGGDLIDVKRSVDSTNTKSKKFRQKKIQI